MTRNYSWYWDKVRALSTDTGTTHVESGDIMKIIDIKNNDKFLDEYIKLCSLEWGTPKNDSEMKAYIVNKRKKILEEDKVISILGLVDNNTLIGFISLFKYDGDYHRDLTPWYATMYVKKEYRNKGYSKLLNNAILNEARKKGYNKVYLKTELENYYEKFGAIFIENLPEEKLYYIPLN